MTMQNGIQPSASAIAYLKLTAPIIVIYDNNFRNLAEKRTLMGRVRVHHFPSIRFRSSSGKRSMA